MGKLVSVIMAVYNEEEKHLREAIDSILNQTYKDIEFIIVLDNPLNSTLLSILEEYKEQDNRIILLVNEQNEGLVYSLNRALSVANGVYIARMDADDISLVNRFEKQLEYLKIHNYDLVGSDVNIIDEDGNKLSKIQFSSTKYIRFMLSTGVIHLSHPTFFAKKYVYDKLEGYRYVLHAEDMDFIARSVCHGFKIGNISETLFYYRHRNSSVTSLNGLLSNRVSKQIAKAYRKCIFTKIYTLNENIDKTIEITEEQKQNYIDSKRLHKLAIKYKNKKSIKKYLKYIVLSSYKSTYMKDYLFMRIVDKILKIRKKVSKIFFN